MTEKLALGISAIRTNRYLSIALEFGSEEFLRPDLVRDILITLKNKEGKTLRTLSSSNDFQNSDGTFIIGTVLFGEETPTEVFGCVIDSSKKKYLGQCQVVENVDTITGSQF